MKEATNKIIKTKQEESKNRLLRYASIKPANIQFIESPVRKKKSMTNFKFSKLVGEDIHQLSKNKARSKEFNSENNNSKLKSLSNEDRE
jgi:hypothetical protein